MFQVLDKFTALVDSFTKRFEDNMDWSGRDFWIGFASVLLLATTLRFWNLSGLPIWMDESVTLAFARMPLDMIIFNEIDYHPPLSYVVQHIWHNIVPDPAFARVPAAIAGTATVALLLLMVRDCVSNRAAIFSGLFLALSTSHIHYSQEARMYVFLCLGMAIALWGTMGIISGKGQHRKTTYRIMFVLGGVIAIYSQIIGLPVMALLSLSLLVHSVVSEDRNRELAGWFILNFILFLFTPLILLQIFTLQDHSVDWAP